MIALISFLILIAVFLTVARVAAVALEVTGMSRAAAEFQARSALLGVGFTTIESETWDEGMAVVKRAVEAVQAHSPRVSLVLKADIRPGHSGQLTAKVERVEKALEQG